MRTSVRQYIENPARFKIQLLHWASAYEQIVYLDSNEHSQYYSNYDLLVAVGAVSSLTLNQTPGAFCKLRNYRQETKDWIFGHLNYDLKNDLEALDSRNPDALDFPVLHFFQPLKIFALRGNSLHQYYHTFCKDEVVADFKQISNQHGAAEGRHNRLTINSRLDKSTYLHLLGRMQEHIQRGDIYEANFCQEFYATGIINPLSVYIRLNEISQAPFAAYYKNKSQYLLCSSPERYLQKKGKRIISQPIKGTARRSNDPVKDAEIASNLIKSEKERTENIMITDLVRNDLSRFAEKGSVHVEELCGLYSFDQVHQLISTISANVSAKFDPIELLRKTFPMGSMTGAPKVSAMRIIECLEQHRRGLYSGAVGYIDPSGDFDFNVVIRSILYNEATAYSSFSVGSAITAQSDPEQEYRECLLKAQAMRSVLET